jgi:hypothetical protein
MMKVDDLSKTTHSQGSRFRFSSKSKETEHFTSFESSQSWTPEDNDLVDDLKATSTHTHSFFKISRSKSMDKETLWPMARTSLASMRAYSFRVPKIHSSNDGATLYTLPSKEENDFRNDSSHNDNTIEMDAFDDEVAHDTIITTTTPPPRQDGTVVRRCRAKQLSKGRRSMSKVQTRSVRCGSEGSWDKFIVSATVPGSDVGQG